MNDFTLNELENLGYMVDQFIVKPDPNCNFGDYLNLGNKIQLMIDNYDQQKLHEMHIDWDKATIRNISNE